MKFLVLAMILLSAAAGCALREDGARRPLTGGFSEASVTDEEVVEAAHFAVNEFGAAVYPGQKVSLLEIVSAEQQVVAGMNYRLVVRIESDGRKHLAEAVVWRKLSGKYELVSWR